MVPSAARATSASTSELAGIATRQRQWPSGSLGVELPGNVEWIPSHSAAAFGIERQLSFCGKMAYDPSMGADPLSLALGKKAATIALGEINAILKKNGVYDRVVDFISGRRPVTVIVLGSSGTGKSAFLNWLRGLSVEISARDRTQNMKEVSGRLEGTAFEFIDTPGDVGHRDQRAVAYARAMGKHKFGIINVVANGYAEREETKGLAFDKAGNLKRAHLDAERKRELERVTEWATALAGGGVQWLLTVATKADLWWSQDEAARVGTLYGSEESDYVKQLGRLRFSPRAVQFNSSVGQLYCGQVPMSGFYTDAERANHRAELVAELLQLATAAVK